VVFRCEVEYGPPIEDVEIVDRFDRDAGLESRSAAVQGAIRKLAGPQLEADYATAWEAYVELTETLWRPFSSLQTQGCRRLLGGHAALR